MNTERKFVAIKCIELAIYDIFGAKKKTERDIVVLACQYGKSINLTKKEVLDVFEMKVRDVMLSNIKKKEK
ncbi:MAG: hypothetical protein HQK96_01570 [Nitrospirae bacterium]|nr:hypothetical protein [Nitrospirota bacterium]